MIRIHEIEGGVDFIEGVTLDRYTIDCELPGGMLACWVKHPTDYMRENHCDACPKVCSPAEVLPISSDAPQVHRPRNTACSFAKRIETPYTEPVLYVFGTTTVAPYVKVDIEEHPRKRASRVILKKVA